MSLRLGPFGAASRSSARRLGGLTLVLALLLGCQAGSPIAQRAVRNASAPRPSSAAEAEAVLAFLPLRPSATRPIAAGWRIAPSRTLATWSALELGRKVVHPARIEEALVAGEAGTGPAWTRETLASVAGATGADLVIWPERLEGDAVRLHARAFGESTDVAAWSGLVLSPRPGESLERFYFDLPRRLVEALSPRMTGRGLANLGFDPEGPRPATLPDDRARAAAEAWTGTPPAHRAAEHHLARLAARFPHQPAPWVDLAFLETLAVAGSGDPDALSRLDAAPQVARHLAWLRRDLTPAQILRLQFVDHLSVGLADGDALRADLIAALPEDGVERSLLAWLHPAESPARFSIGARPPRDGYLAWALSSAARLPGRAAREAWALDLLQDRATRTRALVTPFVFEQARRRKQQEGDLVTAGRLARLAVPLAVMEGLELGRTRCLELTDADRARCFGILATFLRDAEAGGTPAPSETPASDVPGAAEEATTGGPGADAPGKTPDLARLDTHEPDEVAARSPAVPTRADGTWIQDEARWANAISEAARAFFRPQVPGFREVDARLRIAPELAAVLYWRARLSDDLDQIEAEVRRTGPLVRRPAALLHTPIAVVRARIDARLRDTLQSMHAGLPEAVAREVEAALAEATADAIPAPTPATAAIRLPRHAQTIVAASLVAHDEEGLDLLERAQSRRAHPAFVHAIDARLARQSESIADRTRRLEEGARRFPHDPDLPRRGATLALDAGRLEEARSRFETLRQRSEHGVFGCDGLAELHRRAGDFSAIAPLYEGCLERTSAPEAASVFLLRLARIEMDADRPAAALLRLAEAERRAGNRPELKLALGDALALMGNVDAAAAAYRAHDRLAAGAFEGGRRGLGLALERGDPRVVRALLETAPASDLPASRPAAWYATAARVFRAADDLQGFERWALRHGGYARLEWARFLLETGQRPEEARRLLEAAEPELGTDEPQLARLIAEAALAQGDAATAVEAARRAHAGADSIEIAALYLEARARAGHQTWLAEFAERTAPSDPAHWMARAWFRADTEGWTAARETLAEAAIRLYPAGTKDDWPEDLAVLSLLEARFAAKERIAGGEALRGRLQWLTRRLGYRAEIWQALARAEGAGLAARLPQAQRATAKAERLRPTRVARRAPAAPAPADDWRQAAR